jgi:hypothetical protein
LHESECAFCAYFHQQLQISLIPSVLRTYKWWRLSLSCSWLHLNVGVVSTFEAVMDISAHINLRGKVRKCYVFYCHQLVRCLFIHLLLTSLHYFFHIVTFSVDALV